MNMIITAREMRNVAHEHRGDLYRDDEGLATRQIAFAGKETHQGKRVVITAISARRLTTRPADPATDAREARVPIQRGACFVSDGDMVCFKHSGFANNGGYSLLRCIRQP